MNKNTWYKVGNQSLAVYARNAGFDLAIYDEYSDAVKTELRKRTVTEAMRSIEWACQEHGFDLPGLIGGVYVISLANPLSLLYPGGRSQVLYIGRGNVHVRIKSHFGNRPAIPHPQQTSAPNFRPLLPAVRQQLFNPAVGPGWQLFHHVLEVSVWIVAIEFGRLDQTHHRRRPLARSE